MNKQTISIINGVEISAVSDENHNIFVPIKPICDILGIDIDSQRDKIQNDDILSSTAVLSTAVAADGKQREMLCLPLCYAYGWIFSINPKNVAPSARENVSRYRRECYDVLYRHFAGSLRRRVEENEAEIAALKAVNEAISLEKEAKAARRKAEERLEAIRKSRLDHCPCLDL